MKETKKYYLIKDRIEIYKDFSINLLNYIIDYYLDKDTLSEDEDIENHFNWCFNKVCDEFKLENIDFSSNVVLREYFYRFYYYQLYKSKNVVNSKDSLDYYDNFWRNIFNVDKQNNKNYINTLIEIYNVFDASISKEKNILELVQ